VHHHQKIISLKTAFFVLITVLVGTISSLYARQMESIPGRLIVKIRKPSGGNALGAQSVQANLSAIKYGDYKIDKNPLRPPSEKKCVGVNASAVEDPYGMDRYFILDLPELHNTNVDMEAVAAQLERENPGVFEHVSPDYLFPLEAVPNDPKFSNQWGLEKIKAPAAWDISTGSPNTVIAISDTGINYTHPDLAANMWVNSDEIPGDGIDDCNNGNLNNLQGEHFLFFGQPFFYLIKTNTMN